ncbi:hypothetical protein AVEN_83282-1 [Araneus ventricosus]|uniref:Uncharacterized protein n=1 Tax=Araneus ventricosus TaxID=182803 RepID=A0A4Y2VGX2_ARAVE|nr:hypothetical protein AVEN_39949-1 [Araneus ventricosus]GBO23729.1 hypothetical protein AVEN_83282-1 [Araneus ventricosus]
MPQTHSRFQAIIQTNNSSLFHLRVSMNKQPKQQLFHQKITHTNSNKSGLDTIWNRIPSHDVHYYPIAWRPQKRYYMQCTSLFYTESSNYPLQSGSVITFLRFFPLLAGNGEEAGSMDKSPVNLFSIIIIISKVRSLDKIKVKLHPSFTSGAGAEVITWMVRMLAQRRGRAYDCILIGHL